MSRLETKTAVKLDPRLLILSALTLFLILPLLLGIGFSWPSSLPVVLVALSGVCLVVVLFSSLLERNELASVFLVSAVLALTATLIWTWREVLTNLGHLRLGLLIVFLVTFLGNLLYNQIRPSQRSGLWPTLGTSALPVALVCSCYLLLSAVARLEVAGVRFLVGIGLAISYFNLGATIFAGGPPLDAGLVLPDGNRLLGDGKTWRGSLFGVVVATLVFAVMVGPVLTGLIVGLTTLLGDAGASFFKRRLGQAQSKAVPLLDQLDGLLPLLYLSRFNLTSFTLPPEAVPILLIGTLFIQISGNRLLFHLGRKAVPW